MNKALTTVLPNMNCIFTQSSCINMQFRKRTICMPMKMFFRNYREKIPSPTNNFSFEAHF